MRRILVVDDETLVVDMLIKGLTSDRVQVAGANNGQDALAYIQSHPVDVVVTDVMMPGMLGTELFFKIKEIEPFMQIIVITGVPTGENLAQMLKGGANDFIIKPFTIDKLQSVVAEAFGRLDRWRESTKQWIEKGNVH